MSSGATAPQRPTPSELGNQALLRKLGDEDDRRAYFSALAARSHARRVSISGEEADALAAAYRLLGDVLARFRAAHDAPAPATDPTG